MAVKGPQFHLEFTRSVDQLRPQFLGACNGEKPALNNIIDWEAEYHIVHTYTACKSQPPMPINWTITRHARKHLAPLPWTPTAVEREPDCGTELSTTYSDALRIPQVVCGLLSSISLLLFSAKFSTYATPPADAQGTVDGTGFLHAIWLFRDNLRLQQQLEQVDEPSDQNLRKAGMIRSRLADPGNRVAAAGTQTGWVDSAKGSGGQAISRSPSANTQKENAPKKYAPW
ncbi:hypothetical protein B0H13DRAFT_1919319 [Mycena leptocephala]|nr:hypothetical protein B0H13DRAFT_1919319 [Mycena leptocephala]